MKEKILIIGGGNHHNALGVIRAIGKRGYFVELITFGNLRKNYIASSKYVNVHYALANLDRLADYLMSRKLSDNKDIIISCADAATEYLNNHSDVLSQHYILPGTEKQGRMLELMDKAVMIKMTSNRGIASPQIWTLAKDINKITFPCITKSYLSAHGGKADIVICRNKIQLDTFIQENSDDIFVQEYIDKKEEVQFIGCSLNGGKEIIIPGMTKIIRSQPNTNTGFLEYGPIDSFYNETIEKSKAYIKDCGYSGLFSIEYLRGKDDKVYFLEINFRNDGNAWCVTKAGINLPVIWVKACQGEDYQDEIREPKRILMMPEFQDFKLVLQRKVSFRRWFKDWKRTDYFMEYDKADKRPFFQYIIDKTK